MTDYIMTYIIMCYPIDNFRQFSNRTFRQTLPKRFCRIDIVSRGVSRNPEYFVGKLFQIIRTKQA